MAAPYQGLRDRVVAAVDARYAETLLFRPMKGSSRDVSRAECNVSGVLRTGDMEARSMQGGVRQGKERMQIAGATALLALAVADYAELAVLERDSFQAAARPGEPWFKVLFVDRRHHGRIFVYLGDG